MPNPTKEVDSNPHFSPDSAGHGQSNTHSAWLERAARLPGKSIHLAVVLQRLVVSSNACRVVLDNVSCLRFGLSRNAKYRALRSLEEVGLVAVMRKVGRAPIVTVRDERCDEC